MKRFFAFLLALSLCTMLTATPALAAWERELDAPKLVSSFTEMVAATPVEEWYPDANHRALLATLALMDIFLLQNDTYTNIAKAAIQSNNVFVALGNGRTQVTIYFYSNDMELCLDYFPADNRLCIATDVADWMSWYSPEQMISDLTTLGIFETYNHVPSESIASFYTALLEMFE